VSNVVDFPTEPFRKNLERWVQEFFGALAARGLNVEQQNEVFTHILKDMGLQQIDGVWQMPKIEHSVSCGSWYAKPCDCIAGNSTRER
jgi:hypothetical protein